MSRTESWGYYLFEALGVNAMRTALPVTAHRLDCLWEDLDWAMSWRAAHNMDLGDLRAMFQNKMMDGVANVWGRYTGSVLRRASVVLIDKLFALRRHCSTHLTRHYTSKSRV